MSVFRVIKNKNYTVMSNHHLQNINLSYKAKGLLSYMLSLPEDWDYSMNGLVVKSKEQIKAIRNIIRELEQFGYLVRIKRKNEKGLFVYDYNIYEYPYTHNGQVDNLPMEKDIQQNTKNQSTNNKDKLDKQNLNYLTLELINKNFIEEFDLDIFKYNNLFDNLLIEYDYKTVVIATNYVLKRWKTNKGIDENNNQIENKFSYFKTALLANLAKIKEDNVSEWFMGSE